MKKLIITLSFLLFAGASVAQSFTLSGTVFDTLSMRNIPFASVSMLSSDSVLLASVRSKQNGSFKFTISDSGQYILLVSHPQFLLHTRSINFTAATSRVDLKKVALFHKKKMLKQVVIKDKKAVVIKGDTITFAADSFQTKAGDVVEDLLKLLPGMQVDDGGNITSQGKKVETVLVNGEEFFGEDPTMATQNLPSKVVDKVEVYDAKDAQEEFTGFTTDKDSKVINLKLKKGMNRGLMGKVSSAAGANDRWAQRAMLNRFQDKEQMSAYYLSSSNGNARIGWQDGNNYGRETSGASTGGSSEFRGGAPYGITKTWKTGGRYANKFEKRKQELNISYGYARSAQDRNKRSYTENLLPDNTFFKSDTSTSQNISSAHAVNLRYETDIDSLLRLEYSLRFSLQSNEVNQEKQYYNRNDAEAPISFNNSQFTSEGLGTNVGNTITLNKKFNKKGRTLSNRFSYNYSSNNSTGYLLSTNALNLLNGGQIINVDQKKTSQSRNGNLTNNITYTEPISEKIKMKINYRYSDARNNNSNITADTLGSSNGSYVNQLDSLSNIFSSRQITNSPGLVLRFDNKKWRVSLDNSFAFTQFIQTDELRENDFDYKQFNYIPGATVRYKISKYKSIRLSYNGRTQMPSANQLQPFQDNTNPLSVIVGNPNLRMSYRQNISTYFSSYAPIEGHNMYLNLWGGNSINPIGTNRTFEADGRTVTTYLNLPNSYNAGVWGYMGRKIQSTHYRYSLRTSGQYSYNPNVINSIAGASENLSLTLNPGINYYNKELLSINAGAEFIYNDNKNTGNADRRVSYWRQEYNANIDLFFPRFITVSSNLSYEFTPVVAPYNTPFQRTFWRPSISKQFLTKRNLFIKFEIFDALNQNQGYNRQNNVNYNTESFYNTLGRYWLLSATWNFFTGPSKNRKGKFGKAGDKSGQGWLGKKKKKEASATPASNSNDGVIIFTD